jgi:hypothetical protein
MASSSSTGRRAVAALPFLGFSVLIGVAFMSARSMLPDALSSTIESGLFSANGAEARLLPAVYGIGPLDEALRPITAAFSYLNLYPADPPTWWLSLVFLSEFAGIYAVLLLEASRPAYKWSIWGLYVALFPPKQLVVCVAC